MAGVGETLGTKLEKRSTVPRTPTPEISSSTPPTFAFNRNPESSPISTPGPGSPTRHLRRLDENLVCAPITISLLSPNCRQPSNCLVPLSVFRLSSESSCCRVGQGSGRRTGLAQLALSGLAGAPSLGPGKSSQGAGGLQGRAGA